MVPKPKVYVIGVGMTKFEKPGRRDNFDYPQMAKEAVTKALQDARVRYEDVKSVCVGYVYGDSTSGQRACYEIGLTGCPIYNVNNNCASGTTALYLGKQIIESGNADCVLALGFEKMEKGSLGVKYSDRTNPMDKHFMLMAEIGSFGQGPPVPQLFSNAGIEHMKKYGTKPEHFAKIAYKNHKHSVNNPYSQFQTEYSMEQVMNSAKVCGPLTMLQCCPTSDGAGAVILASEDFVRKHHLEPQAVEVVAMALCTDKSATFDSKSCMNIVGYDMSKNAAEKVFAESNYKPSDVDVIELHDCFSVNELITYEALGLCGPGEAGKMVDAGDNTYGGKYVINPSGGLISKGHPLGATGLAQCAELTWQLRGQAGKRQVPGAKLALQHNIGLGGAAVVALYRLGFPNQVIRKNTNVAADSSIFQADLLFKTLAIAMEEDEDGLIERMRGVYGFKVTNGPGGAEGFWVVDAKQGKGKVEYNSKTKPDVTFTISDTDIVDFISGKLNPQKAFFQGKVKIQGNMGLAMKLPDLQKRAAKKLEVLRSRL
ncbi:non-specific lipid-transfer protein [Solenopsis invicta]|uniref:non-specific lipid-transfer protein n=1 Tax=Solenopsis invicta TaxID=13686 RepID=UPI0001FEC157|nr:non-specific lipid-transfer protein [Solenopsis invicta]XP_025993637.1 non-specific lipid-transfer protein [Solenopsis invicta]